MITVRKFSDTEFIDHIKIDFVNTVGLVINKKLILHDYDSKNPIEIDSLKHIRLLKKSKYGIGLLLVFLGLSTLLVIGFGKYRVYEYLLFGLNVLVLFSIAYKANNSEYIIVLNYKNFSYVEVKIDQSRKSDAKKIVARVGKVLKEINK